MPVETYFPGAILPEMLKGAEVYQTEDGPITVRQESPEEIIKMFICRVVAPTTCAT